MEYKISEIANILGVSSEMIRYYEKCGIIKPKRTGNNYRVYSPMDLFAILDAMRLSRIGINIKEIQKTTTQEEFNRYLAEYYRQYAKEIESSIKYQSLLKTRIEELKDRTEMIPENEGNYWIKRVPEQILYPAMISRNDDYEKIRLSPEDLQNILSQDNYIFFDIILEFGEDKDQWFFSIQRKYADALHLAVREEGIHKESHYVICSAVDMGNIGDYRTGIFVSAREIARKKGYQLSTSPKGILLIRYSDSGDFRRFLEYQIPIEKL